MRFISQLFLIVLPVYVTCFDMCARKGRDFTTKLDYIKMGKKKYAKILLLLSTGKRKQREKGAANV